MKHLLLMLCLLAGINTYAQNKPNIIFIFSDDHAYQAISAYGNKQVKTPNIDRIAREGALFTNAMVTNSICGPSRATLLTGKYSHKNGYPLNEQKFDVTQTLFPRILQQNGYQTAWIGKWHLGSLPQGFDYWRVLPGQGNYYNPDFISAKDTSRIPGYVTNIITDLSLDWLNNRDTSKPFMLIVGEKATHREWLPDLQDLGAYDSINFPLPKTFYDNYEGRKAAADQDMTVARTMRLREDLKVDIDYNGKNFYNRFTQEQREVFKSYYDKISAQKPQNTEWKYQRYMKDYLATARSLDRNIGNILHYLDSTGLSKNTIVIYASDQGFYMGEHGWFDKRFMYEESLRTPFVIRYPGVVKPGTKINQFMLNIDWAPTFLDMAGVTPPAEMQGVSYLPLLKGKNIQWRKAVYYHYYEFPEPHHVSPHFGVRTERYKLIRFYSKTADSWELFDLKTDPHELHNIYGKNPKIETSLKETLKALIIKYDDQEALKIINGPQPL